MGIFMLGAIVGGVVTHRAAVLHDALDKGVSYTYRCDELGRQADERDSLRDILAASWTGRPAAEAEAVLAGAGLLQIRKGGEALIAGRGKRGDVTFVIQDARVANIDISGIDGRCASPQGEN